jgi:hypothetical protein
MAPLTESAQCSHQSDDFRHTPNPNTLRQHFQTDTTQHSRKVRCSTMRLYPHTPYEAQLLSLYYRASQQGRKNSGHVPGLAAQNRGYSA